MWRINSSGAILSFSLVFFKFIPKRKGFQMPHTIYWKTSTLFQFSTCLNRTPVLNLKILIAVILLSWIRLVVIPRVPLRVNTLDLHLRCKLPIMSKYHASSKKIFHCAHLVIMFVWVSHDNFAKRPHLVARNVTPFVQWCPVLNLVFKIKTVIYHGP